jgi:murein L,D-transpeptidase YcbB/YkuD
MGFSLPAAGESSLEQSLRLVLEHGVARTLKVKAHGIDPQVIDSRLLERYRQRAFAPFWIKDNGLSARAKAARQVLEDSYQDGLDPSDYFTPFIDGRWRKTDPRNLAELDVLLTLGIMRLAADALEGRIEPSDVDAKLFAGVRPERPNLKRLIGEVLDREDIAAAVREQFPGHRQYQRMREALAEYRQISKSGGWGVVPAGSTMAAGARDTRVNALAGRLRKSGALDPAVKGDVFGPEIEAAVKAFQLRHGLPGTGKVDSKTLAALNVSAEERSRTLVINMERWRWLQRDFKEGKEVLVNIAGYELFGVDSGKPAIRIPVIVGKTYHATPVFSSVIRYIEVNPYWNVPVSIASKEILPKLRKDAGYLSKQHMRIYDGWDSSAKEMSASGINWAEVSSQQIKGYAIRQDPGPWNALGRFKFVFPNEYSVYLHDTSAPRFFAEKERAFSHGCIRVGDPPGLAAFLLDSPGDAWTKERVEQLVASGKNQNVSLKTPVPVHLTYRTVWVDLDGSIQFRPDLYGRDRRMAAVIFGSKG